MKCTFEKGLKNNFLNSCIYLWVDTYYFFRLIQVSFQLEKTYLSKGLIIRSFLMLYTSFFSHEIMAMKKSYLPEDFWLKTILCSYSNIIKIWLQKLSQNQLEIIKVSHVCFYLFFCFCNKISWKKSWDCLIARSVFGRIFCVCLFCLHTTRETWSHYVFNWFLAKINGIQWFRIDS